MLLRPSSSRLPGLLPGVLRATASAPVRALAIKAKADTAAMLQTRADHLDEALRLVRAYAAGRFDESVDVAVVLNTDVKRSDERVRGKCLLPHGSGQEIRVAVFARAEAAEAARAAGADVVGAEDLVDEVLKGRLDFDRCLATPDVMPALAKAARTLGPKGLMPNPKRGSVCSGKDLGAAVQRAKGGEVPFKQQKTGVVHATIGRASFTPMQLRENASAMLRDIMKARAQRFQHKPPLSISISSTMGPGVPLDQKLW